MKEKVVKNKSFAFAPRVVRRAKYLQGDQKEFVLSKQFLRSGTAIGAMVREAEHAESKSEYITDQNFESIRLDSEELVKLLVSIVKTTERTKYAK